MEAFRKKRMGSAWRALTAVLLAAGLLLGLLDLPASAVPALAAKSRQVEWGSFQNSAENNGISNAPTPQTYQETALKWAKQMVSGYTTSFTPPLIIDGALYTASMTHVYRINKETGEIEKESPELKLNVGYAMNPITYDPDHDLIFVPILNGRVACLSLEKDFYDPGKVPAGADIRWTSQSYPYTQSLSPITYAGGCVYTGIWAGEEKDGVYFCLDALTGEEKWTFSPQKDAGAKLARGFYWAGAYATSRYIVFGSDDGQNNTFAPSGDASYSETASIYSVDAKSGRLIDQINGCAGDIRSTMVYHNGYLYATSKGGKLYKVKINADGSFVHESLSSITMPGNGQMTAAPVVYNGRIYVGVAGSGGQFSSDGGHFFAVLRDDSKLSQDSLIYTVKIPGYPQAAPLLSTATEKTDGKVRLYFTFNAFPGGIYYLEDAANATSGTAHLLFRPELSMQQYCISPLCADSQGTLYLKNDSGYLMAVATNKAWLDDVSVQVGNDPAGSWEPDFESGILNYRINLPNGTKTVYVKARLSAECSDASVSVNGQAVKVDPKSLETERKAVRISSEEDCVTVTVEKKVGGRTYDRTYTLWLASLANNADLAGFAINSSNSMPALIVDGEGGSASQVSGPGTGIGYDPKFEAGITEYVSHVYDGNHAFVNLWPQAADQKASIRVLPVENVGNGVNESNGDGSLRLYQSNSAIRCPVYWVEGQKTAIVSVEVTSASGQQKKTYEITLQRDETHLDIGKKPLVLSPSATVLYSKGKGRTSQISASYGGMDVTGSCSFVSSDPAVVTVDPQGTMAAGREGDAEVWVTYQTQTMRLRSLVHVTVEMPVAAEPEADIEAEKTYDRPLKIALSSRSASALIRYEMGDPDGEVPAPTTTSGSLYEEPITVGKAGERTRVLIRAIAYGNGYKKSKTVDLVYEVDLTGQGQDREGSLQSLALYKDGKEIKTLTAADGKPFAQGTSIEALKTALEGVTALARITGKESQTVEEIPGLPVKWDLEEIDYDPADYQAADFKIIGTVKLPEGVQTNGKKTSLSIRVQVAAGQVEPPVADPAPGTYTEDTAIRLSTNTKGAAIIYRSSDEKEDATYTGPILFNAKEGEKHSLTIKAYAVRNGVESPLSTFTYTIDRTDGKAGEEKAGNEAAAKALAKAKAKAKSAKTTLTVKAKKKGKASLSWKKVKGVTGYQIYRSTQKKGKYKCIKTIKKAKTVSFTDSKLKKGKKYYYKVVPYTSIEKKKVAGKASKIVWIKAKK